MSRRAFRIIALAVLAAVLLGPGVVAWDWVIDYRLYRREVESLSLPGQEPTSSFEEFLAYRRAIEFYETAERLADRNATAEEVRAALGEPSHKSLHEAHGVESWFYPGPVFRERRQPTIVVRIDLDTSRVASMQHIFHG